MKSTFFLTMALGLLLGTTLLTPFGCVVESYPDPNDSDLPLVATAVITDIGLNSARCGGLVSDQGSSSVIARGVCWSTNPGPTIADNTTSNGNGSGSYNSTMTGLSLHTTYYVRAYATNSHGTSYGDEAIFTAATVRDIDGNLYRFIGIGSQIWMVENLKVRTYRDGDPITNILSTTWGNITSPGFCWYDNDYATYKEPYGALYNWYAVSTGKLSPPGWHVPTDAEWTELITFLGDSTTSGASLKDSGTTYWNLPNTGATNSSGFAGLPGGMRVWTDELIGEAGRWWTTTDTTGGVWSYGLSHNSTNVSRILAAKERGFSVRCIKD